MARNTFFLAGCLTILTLIPGCKWYTYQDTTVLVTDGETGESLADAAVHIHAIRISTFNLPEDIAVHMDSDGAARIRLVDNNPYFLNVEAEGYRAINLVPNWSWGVTHGNELPASYLIPEDHHASLSQADSSDPNDIDQINIKLFRNPAPSLRIIVPDGYRGLIKIHLVQYPGVSPDLPAGRVHEITTNAHGEAGLIEQHLIWNEFDRRDQIVVVESGREYPLILSRSGGHAASWIELYRVPGLLIHLGNENDHARDIPTVPGRQRKNTGGVELTRMPSYAEMRQFMHNARQQTPQ